LNLGGIWKKGEELVHPRYERSRGKGRLIEFMECKFSRNGTGVRGGGESQRIIFNSSAPKTKLAF
jgi:hypothetical protein